MRKPAITVRSSQNGARPDPDNGPAVLRMGNSFVVAWATTAALACSSGSAPDSAAIARGEALFHDHLLEGLGGNGRACSDCHMDADSFQLSPANVETRFQQMSASGIDDPLFRPIDADDFVLNGSSANDFQNLRLNGLVRIRMALPDNIRLVDPASCSSGGVAAPCETAEVYALSAATFTDLWRAVPTVLDVRLTGVAPDSLRWDRGPNPEGGYLIDGRAVTLQEQARGALHDHAEAATLPPADSLDDLAAYENQLDAPAEPALDAHETQGKTIFNRACATCHGGPGLNAPASTPRQVRRFSDDYANCPPPTDTESPPRWSFAPCSPSLITNQQTYEIAFADGFKMRRTTTDPGRALLSGYVASAPPAADGRCAHAPCGQEFEDDWGKLDAPGLHGISKTAPYFHNNSAATLEEVVIHYEQLFRRLEAIALPSVLPAILTTDDVHVDRPNVPAERAALVAYLMKL